MGDPNQDDDSPDVKEGDWMPRNLPKRIDHPTDFSHAFAVKTTAADFVFFTR